MRVLAFLNGITVDADGTQAYCDVLEAISRRDRKLIIMSIAHDPVMKARFLQSVEIVNDSGGSHVIGEVVSDCQRKLTLKCHS